MHAATASVVAAAAAAAAATTTYCYDQSTARVQRLRLLQEEDGKGLHVFVVSKSSSIFLSGSSLVGKSAGVEFSWHLTGQGGND